MEKRFYADYFELEDRHWWFLGRRAIFFRVLDHRLGATPSANGRRRILDVGCGTGTMVRDLARYGDVQGVDADPEAVRLCHRRGIENVRLVPPGPLPFADEEFDVITALDVVEHVDDDLGLLNELRRVLAPAGILLVSVPAFQFLWGLQDEVSHHKRRYRSPELRDRLVAAGLNIEHLTYFNTFLFPAVAAIRLARPFKPGNTERRSDFEVTRPGRLNAILARVFAAEAPLVDRFRLPVGVSILGVATR